MWVQFLLAVPHGAINISMNIGFYGHSNCAYRSEDSFIDIIANRFNANIVNIGVRQGSEERILFKLKKTNSLDLAIIFHANPGFTFLPNCDRDVDLTRISFERIEYLMSQEDWDSEFLKKHTPIFREEFKTKENFLNAANVFKEHFYHRDLILNRYYGALMQIDRFLVDRKIPVLHVLSESNSVPHWFEFKSGPVDYEIMKLCDTYKSKQNFFVNLITKEGNLAVADVLEKKLRSCLVATAPGSSPVS